MDIKYNKILFYSILYEFLYVINCNSTIALSATVSEILTSPPKLSKNDYILFSAGGPDAANDLKLVSGIKNLSIYHMPKYQI